MAGGVTAAGDDAGTAGWGPTPTHPPFPTPHPPSHQPRRPPCRDHQPARRHRRLFSLPLAAKAALAADANFRGYTPMADEALDDGGGGAPDAKEAGRVWGGLVAQWVVGGGWGEPGGLLWGMGERYVSSAPAGRALRALRSRHPPRSHHLTLLPRPRACTLGGNSLPTTPTLPCPCTAPISGRPRPPCPGSGRRWRRHLSRLRWWGRRCCRWRSRGWGLARVRWRQHLRGGARWHSCGRCTTRREPPAPTRQGTGMIGACMGREGAWEGRRPAARPPPGNPPSTLPSRLPQGELGAGAHTDYGFVTLLVAGGPGLQAGGMEGGKWERAGVPG